MPNYRTNDSKGWGGTGRLDKHDPFPASYTGKFYLRRVRLNRDGYDPNGAYFGEGTCLYWYTSEDGTVDAMIRAPSREAAKLLIRVRFYPKATFFS